MPQLHVEQTETATWRNFYPYMGTRLDADKAQGKKLRLNLRVRRDKKEEGVSGLFGLHVLPTSGMTCATGIASISP